MSNYISTDEIIKALSKIDNVDKALVKALTENEKAHKKMFTELSKRIEVLREEIVAIGKRFDDEQVHTRQRRAKAIKHFEGE